MTYLMLPPQAREIEALKDAHPRGFSGRGIFRRGQQAFQRLHLP